MNESYPPYLPASDSAVASHFFTPGERWLEPPPSPPSPPSSLYRRLLLLGGLLGLLDAVVGGIALLSHVPATTTLTQQHPTTLPAATSTGSLLLSPTVTPSYVPIGATATGVSATPTPLPAPVISPAFQALLLYNNRGTSLDAAPTLANFDGVGDSYSAHASANAGILPGEPLVYNQMTFVWPAATADAPNNMVLQGQHVQVTAGRSYARLGFLGAAPFFAQTSLITIVYTDGSTQSASVGVSNWVVGNGVKYGNGIVATLPYDNTTKGQTVKPVAIYDAEVTLLPQKIVTEIDFPVAELTHLFAIAAA